MGLKKVFLSSVGSALEGLSCVARGWALSLFLFYLLRLRLPVELMSNKSGGGVRIGRVSGIEIQGVNGTKTKIRVNGLRPYFRGERGGGILLFLPE